MDMKKGRSKNNQGNGSQRMPSVQDMALASQLGLAGLFDPTLMGAAGMMPGGLDAQQLLAGAGGMPMMDPAAFAALGAMGALPPGGFPPGFLPGNAATDWLAMAQQAQLLAAMGGAIPPAFLPQLNAANAFGSLGDQNGASSSKQSSSSSSKRSLSANRKSPSASPAQGSKSSWLNNNATSSRTTPNRSSPRPSTPSRQSRKIKSPNMSASETVSKVISNQYEALAQKQAQTEQIMQAELMRQVEQQFILQQVQLQQQQEQIQAALQVLNKKQTKSPQSSQRSSSTPHHNSSSPAVPDFMLNSLNPSQANIEALLALNQLSQGGSHHPTNRSRPSSRQSSSHGGASSSGRSSSHNRDHKPPEKLQTGGLDPQVAKAFDSDPGAFMAALYSQMNQQEQKQRSSPAFLGPTVAQEKSSTSTKPTENRSRRKQANPTSVPSSLPRQAASSPLGSSTSQTSPLPLVKARPTPERPEPRKSASPAKLVKQFPQRKQNSSPAMNASKSKAPKNATDANMDFFAALHGQAPLADAGQPSQEDLNKLMLAAYGEMLASSGTGGKGGDLNKINELLTATVAAEMHRLQMEQLNLTRELESLSNSKSKDSDMSDKGNRVSVIHKAQSRSSDSSHDHEPIGDVAQDDRSTSRGHGAADGDTKRQRDAYASDKPPRKTRRLATNESDLKEPLQMGWSREVRFIGDPDDFKSDVTYFSPDGKKFTSLEDIVQHLTETSEPKFDKQHFSFSTNARIGAFYHRPSQDDDFDNERKLDPLQAEKFFSKLDEKAGVGDDSNVDETDGTKRSEDSWKFGQNQDAKKLLEDRCFKEAGQKAMKQAAELKLQQKNEQRRLAKLLRQKERQQKLEQQKLEKEMRERQMLEERQKMEAARKMKYQEALRKAEERELQRQQQLLFKQQERERRRQHLILLKNIETKRRAAERDRRREEMRNEKIYIRERKLEQRRRAMKLARELKMPVEDMRLKSLRPLPKLDNLQGTVCDKENSGRWTQLSGNATADLLMVLEFLLTFKDAILLEESVIPTFEQLQRGLLNDPEHTGSLVQLTMALLHQCLCDPGVPAPGPWLHCSTGVKVTDIDVSKSNYSEILRLFLWARNGHKTEITDYLETEPFLSLSADQKAEILAFLVNELVCSQPVCSEIERHLDKLASLRRDKWVVEGKIRQARVEHANDESDASANSPLKSRTKLRQPISGEAEEKEDKDSVKGDEDSNQSSAENKTKTETPMERKMKQLTQEHQAFNEKMFAGSKPLRALDLGQDRFKRRYWVLSNVGGIYVEGLESGSWLDEDAETEAEAGEEKAKEVKEEECQETKTEPADGDQSKPESTDHADNSEKPAVKNEPADRTTVDAKNEPEPSVAPVDAATKPEPPVLHNGPDKVENENPIGDSPTVDQSLTTGEKTVEKAQQLPAELPDVNGIDVKASPRHEYDVSRRKSGEGEKKVEEEDSVVAAAKAIAAKAVATSSHILYPNQSKTPSQEQSRSELGKLTALTLQSIGVDPSKLTQAQMEVLTRISAPNQDDPSDASQSRPKTVDSPQLSTTASPKPPSDASKDQSAMETSEDSLQNAPIDLSRPSTAASRQQTESPSPASSFNPFNSALHPAQAALAFGGLPPGVFDGAMGFKNDVASAELLAAVKQEFGSEENFEIGLKWRAEDQHDQPKPIPKESKYGWWKICEEKVLDELTENLHCRGIREKHLSRTIAKYRSYCTDAMQEAKKPENQFANGPVQEPEEKKAEKEKEGDEDKEETMETDEPKLTRAKRKALLEAEDILENPEETAFQIEMETLKQVEELSDRCVAVGILNKAWSTTPKASLNRLDLAHVPLSREHDPNVKHDCSNPVQHDPLSVMHAAVELVRKLELALSRLYLKPPLIRKGGATEFSSLPSLSDSGMNDVAAGLRTWRNAVSSATSAAQLSMCVTMLESCIAWEKTPMSSTRSDASPRPKKRRQAPKAQTAPSGGSAAKKKKVSCKSAEPATPEAAFSDDNSHQSGRIPIDNADALKPTEKTRGDAGTSSLTNDVTHTDDVDRDDDDDGAEMRELPFSGPAYNNEAGDTEALGSIESGSEVKKKKKKSKKKKDKDKEKDREKGDKSAKRKKSHTTFCREMLRELQSHGSANWFLYPVDLNEVPDYKKIIKKPIDFSTIENRLRKGRYKTHEMFSAEVRTVFENCRIYNEDESAIGRAGHDLREFFERRWAEILDSNRDLIEASLTSEDLSAL